MFSKDRVGAGGMVLGVLGAMGSGRAGEASLPPLLRCSPVPNRPCISPGGWGPPALSERMVNVSAIAAKIESGNTEKMGLRDYVFPMCITLGRHFRSASIWPTAQQSKDSRAAVSSSICKAEFRCVS